MIEQGTPFAAIVATARTSDTFTDLIKEPVLVMVSQVPTEAGLGFATRNASDMDALSMRQTEALRQTPLRGLVFFLRKRESGIFSDKIGLGRTRNVDICIPNSQISKYHAFFSLNGDNVWTITDADSKNGTRVGDQRLVAGVAKGLQSERKIIAGGLEFIFYLPADFLPCCRKATKSDSAVPGAR
jgi:hypothetical protein